jgi:hypothetical protein
MVTATEEQRNSVFWRPVLRGYNWENPQDKGLLWLNLVCEGTNFLSSIERFSLDEAAAAGISHGTCHKILSDDLNTSRVTQHSAACVLM